MCLPHNYPPAYKIATQGGGRLYGNRLGRHWVSVLISRRGNPVRVAVELPVLIGGGVEFNGDGHECGRDVGIGVPQARRLHHDEQTVIIANRPKLGVM